MHIYFLKDSTRILKNGSRSYATMLSRYHKQISHARDTVDHTYRVSSVAYVGQQGEGYTELEHCGSKLLLLPHQGRRVPCDILHLQYSSHERVSRQ